MKQEKKTQIANICYAVVSNNFAMFCNPENRGANFSWSRFPDMQEGKCSLQVKMQLPDSQFNEETEKLAKEFGREIAENLVTRAGFIN